MSLVLVQKSIYKNFYEIKKKRVNSSSPLHVAVDNDLTNEYTENSFSLASAFPFLFPFGISADLFTATVPKRIVATWLLFHDKRFAECSDFIFLMFDQKRRHDVNRKVSARIKHESGRVNKFIQYINAPDFTEN